MKVCWKALLIAALLWSNRSPRAQTDGKPDSHGPWVFAGFKNNSEDGVFFALSRDGYHWQLVHGGKPVMSPAEPAELMRDPFLQRAPDGSFHMVWTWSWRTPAVLGYSTSSDLVHWSPHRQLPILASEPTALNAWAPALYRQPAQKQWILLWTSTIPGRFPGPVTETNGLDHRIFFVTTKDFKSFSPAHVFFDPGYSVIDATLLPGATPALVFKDEREIPLEKHLRTVAGKTMEGPWSTPSPSFTETWSEGPAAIQVDAGTLVYYDHYRAPQHFGATLLPAGETKWRNVSAEIEFPAGLRHGSFLRITEAEYRRLLAF